MTRAVARLSFVLEVSAAGLVGLWAVLLAALWRSPALEGSRGPWLVTLALAALSLGLLWLLPRRPELKGRSRGRERPALAAGQARVYQAALALLIPLGLFCQALSMVWGGWIFGAFMALFLVALAAGGLLYARSRRA